MAEDLRRSRRLNHHLEVRYYYGENTEPVKVFTKDISMGGMHIDNPFPINEKLQFPMQIQLAQPIRAIVRVAWQKKKEEEDIWEMGLEFLQMREDDKEFIAEMIDSAEA